MRQAKTIFSRLGSLITHVDVTYDGKWILGTTDTYLILICTLFIDKNGSTKTDLAGCMGNKISAPRLLNLNPLDSQWLELTSFAVLSFHGVEDKGGNGGLMCGGGGGWGMGDGVAECDGDGG
ncbi:hypothetical protein FXO38_04033 [Capsicum annuum]|uniref:Vacuolar import/degradation Vid27 C-terminal domain-containing protein n=1 Tax=Capsicum annuum TaxID=4072 RepID=A0A2G2Z9J2_CAPAN|nr:hypothetical protein FXO37_15294 [Capsicum annuum]KAF3676956.1 hypothetical protein FXO38_04033 [Capsicum annuum]PHT78571.1 hypothetical protein T459_16623 [Capsicum annuum]